MTLSLTSQRDSSPFDTSNEAMKCPSLTFIIAVSPLFAPQVAIRGVALDGQFFSLQVDRVKTIFI